MIDYHRVKVLSEKLGGPAENLKAGFFGGFMGIFPGKIGFHLTETLTGKVGLTRSVFADLK